MICSTFMHYLFVGFAVSGDLPAAQAPAGTFGRGAIMITAHRGGARLWPEETLLAYRSAASRWPDAILEGDVHLSADGTVVMMHDATVDRTTDGTGPVDQLTLARLQALDAGYRFTLDRGKSYPYRGTGLKVPTLREVLNALPQQRFQIEIKGNEELAAATVKVVAQAKAQNRVLLASMDQGAVDRIRRDAPEIPTCLGVVDSSRLLAALRSADWGNYAPPGRMLAMPAGIVRSAKLTRADLERIKAKGVLVQFFTVNDPAQMRELIELGTDSIITDRPDLLAEIVSSLAKPASAAP